MPRVPAVISSQGQSATAVPRTATAAATLAREHTGDRQTQRIQEATNEATKAPLRLPFGDGNLIKGVSFTGGVVKTIAHGLGRRFAGAFPVAVYDAGASFYIDRTQNGLDPTKSGKFDDKQITMCASVTCTADIWVYR